LASARGDTVGPRWALGPLDMNAPHTHGHRREDGGGVIRQRRWPRAMPGAGANPGAAVASLNPSSEIDPSPLPHPQQKWIVRTMGQIPGGQDGMIGAVKP